MDVVDLCSGDGWFTLQIATLARHVTAIDIDGNLLEVARKRLTEQGVTNCDFVAGDAYDVAKLVSQPADSVFMANVFHDVPHGPRLARAVAVALTPTGRFASLDASIGCSTCSTSSPMNAWRSVTLAVLGGRNNMLREYRLHQFDLMLRIYHTCRSRKSHLSGFAR